MLRISRCLTADFSLRGTVKTAYHLRSFARLSSVLISEAASNEITDLLSVVMANLPHARKSQRCRGGTLRALTWLRLLVVIALDTWLRHAYLAGGDLLRQGKTFETDESAWHQEIPVVSCSPDLHNCHVQGVFEVPIDSSV